MVFDQETGYSSQWATIGAIALKIGRTPETLRSRVRQVECERIKVLERENRVLKQANENLRKESAYSAQTELDHRSLMRRVGGVVRGKPIRMTVPDPNKAFPAYVV